jgi:hypothetical protein
MADRPTQEAEYAFNRAAGFFIGPTESATTGQMAYMLKEMASGLAHLSRGLRATYILLEDVKQRLDQQGQLPPGMRR